MIFGKCSLTSWFLICCDLNWAKNDKSAVALAIVIGVMLDVRGPFLLNFPGDYVLSG